MHSNSQLNKVFKFFSNERGGEDRSRGEREGGDVRQTRLESEREEGREDSDRDKVEGGQ